MCLVKAQDEWNGQDVSAECVFDSVSAGACAATRRSRWRCLMGFVEQQ